MVRPRLIVLWIWTYRNLNNDVDNDSHGNCKSCLPEVIIFEEFGISKCPDGYPESAYKSHIE